MRNVIAYIADGATTAAFDMPEGSYSLLEAEKESSRAITRAAPTLFTVALPERIGAAVAITIATQHWALKLAIGISSSFGMSQKNEDLIEMPPTCKPLLCLSAKRDKRPPWPLSAAAIALIKISPLVQALVRYVRCRLGGGHLRIDFGKSRLTLVKNQTCHEVFRHRQLDID